MYINLTTDEAVRLLKKDDNASWSWDGALALVQYYFGVNTQSILAYWKRVRIIHLFPQKIAIKKK
jgi:hypothetical protein